jgi:hypothetical protein
VSSFSSTYIVKSKVPNLEIFLDIYIIFIYFLYHFSCSYFQTLIFYLGFNPTSSNYYLIIIILIILFNEESYKLQQDALSFMLVSFALINHS